MLRAMQCRYATPDDVEAVLSAPDEAKARHLRQLYRDNGGEKGIAMVNAEFDRLYPGEDRLLLAHILKSAWTEARELAGATYDTGTRSWRDDAGNRID